MAKPPTKIVIYTDGSANNAVPLPQRCGGWGAVVISSDGKRRKFSGVCYESTSQQTELTAIIQSLIYVRSKLKDREKAEVFIYSDSAYIVNGFGEKWYEGWEMKNWMGVKNVSYWKTLLMLVQIKELRVTFLKVKGHSGDAHNDIADKLAGEARLRAESFLKEV